MSQQSAFDSHYQNPELELSSRKDHDETTDEKDKKILEFEKKIEEMKIAMNEKNEEIMIKDRKIRKFKKEEKQRKFKLANKVWSSSRTIRDKEWFEGFVIKSNIPYEAGARIFFNGHIKSFNYIYAPRLGIIKAMNHYGETKTELGKWYIFATNDQRRIIKGRTENMPTSKHVRATNIQLMVSKRRTTAVDGKVKLRIIFELDTEILYKERKVYFEDSCLNRVHIPSEFIRLIRETIDNNNLDGEIHVKVDVKLKKRFLEKFEIDVNAAIFEVENIVEIVSDERTIYFE